MTAIDIEEAAADDAALLTAWHGLVVAAGRHDLDGNVPTWTPTELAASICTPGLRRVRVFAARAGADVVAAGRLALPLVDNLDSAEIDVVVHPDHRRRGHGSALLARLENLLRGEGRTRLDAEVSWPYDGPPDGRGEPGPAFARARGYEFGIGDVQRALTLPVPEALLERLIAEAAPHHADYEIRSWAGSVPDELVVGWLELSTTLMTEAPTGEMEREPEAVDVPAFRASEARSVAQGCTSWHTVALDGAGRVVAYSQLVETATDNPFCFQWGTLVHRAHRGHRLGQAVKAANHRAMQAGADVAGRRVVTWNAEINDHMIGINERLGFVPTARGAEFQKRLR